MVRRINKDSSKKAFYVFITLFLVISLLYIVMFSLNALQLGINLDRNTTAFSTEIDKQEVTSFTFNSDGTTRILYVDGIETVKSGVRLSLVRDSAADKTYYVSESNTIIKDMSNMDIVAMFLSTSYLYVLLASVALIIFLAWYTKERKTKATRVYKTLLYINAIGVLEAGIFMLSLLKK